MARGMTLQQMYEKVYDGTPDRVIRIRTSRETTGRKHGFHFFKNKPTLKTAWGIELLKSQARDPSELIASMGARPLYFIPGRNGKPAFLVGHATWNTAATPESRIVGNSPGFRKWVMRRGATTATEDRLFCRGRRWDTKDTDWRWYFGSDSLIQKGGSIEAWSASPWDPVISEFWLSQCLAQGIKLVKHVAFSPYELIVGAYRAVAQFEPGFVNLHGQYASSGAMSDLSTVPAPNNGGGAPGIVNAFWYTPGTVDTSIGAHWYRMFLKMKDESAIAADALRAARTRLTSSCDALASALGVSSELKVGCGLPLPLVSTQVGWVTGFANDHGPLMIEVESFDNSLGANMVDVVSSWASIDIDGKDYKRMFPVSSLPADKQAAATAKLDALPDGILFRSIVMDKGLNYPVGLTYADTVLAVDTKRAGATLDELLFDALEESGPSVSYESLGARSLANITKGKNASFTLVMSSGDASFVSHTAIFFKETNGSIVAYQGDVRIESGQAFVALKTGATATFDKNVDQDIVAIRFFKMPSWSAVLTAISETAAARSYLVDENQNSNDGRFNLGDDESARAIPLILGFDREAFSRISGSLVFGITKPELP